MRFSRGRLSKLACAGNVDQRSTLGVRVHAEEENAVSEFGIWNAVGMEVANGNFRFPNVKCVRECMSRQCRNLKVADIVYA